jgi:hypothetical protein
VFGDRLEPHDSRRCHAHSAGLPLGPRPFRSI